MSSAGRTRIMSAQRRAQALGQTARTGAGGGREFSRSTVLLKRNRGSVRSLRDGGTQAHAEKSGGPSGQLPQGEEDDFDLEAALLEASRQMEEEDNVEVKYDANAEYISNPDEHISNPARDRSTVSDEGEDVPYERIHPLTRANRFATSPSTLEVPLREPLEALVTKTTAQHVEAALRVFGGPGLPWSTSTSARSGGLDNQKAIPLTAAQDSMRPNEAELFMSVLFPGIWASAMGALVETRKRLGTTWAEECVRKAEAGELRILDAGGAGAGVSAVREVLRAEWERMHEEQDPASSMYLAEADGKLGGPGIAPPLGQATVLTASDTLRHAASTLLENTTFVPRLPDYLHASEQALKGKFDIIIAPHSLWSIHNDHVRKTHVLNLWSLLKESGGVLIMLEKGVARGFEAIAGARDMLLNHRIASPASETVESSENPEAAAPLHPPPRNENKEKGMIIAPCTNHVACPLYARKGIVPGRREICAMPQRYHRPNSIQKIFTSGLKGGSGKNHEDVRFSYLSVMRGRDLRDQPFVAANGDTGDEAVVTQGIEATARAFAGYDSSSQSRGKPTTPDSDPHSLSLPRAIFPPLKRTGHVILDLCTPAGTLERWTVPRSFSRRAFGDARKSSWGDLWALGAKTRVMRNLKNSSKVLASANAAADSPPNAAEGQQDDRAQGKYKGEKGYRGAVKQKHKKPARSQKQLHQQDYSPEDDAIMDVFDLEHGQEEISPEQMLRQKRKLARGEREVGYEDEGGRKGQIRKGWVKGIREKRDKRGGSGARVRKGEDEDGDF